MNTSIKGISPTKAILLCINSIIGAGLFINPSSLTRIAGPYGFLGYMLGALLILPIILCIAELAKIHPVAGGLYVYSKTYIGRWAGFLSAWAYFVGKTVSAALLMHKFVQFFQARVYFLQDTPVLLIDIGIILFFTLLNIGGVSIGGNITYFFSALKASPVLATFAIGFFLFDSKNFQEVVSFQDVCSSLPIAVFALLGFEVICAIGNQIHDAKNNIKRVILTSFFIVVAINTIFQTVIFGVVGYDLIEAQEPILVLGLKAFASIPWIGSLLNGLVFASIVGGFFSLLTSNCWNLHTIANNNHLPGKLFLTKCNRNNVPWVSLLIEASIAIFILSITTNQVPLQNMSVVAQIVSFSIAVFAAFYAVTSKAAQELPLWAPLLALLSCCFLFGIAGYKVATSGVSIPFIVLFFVGCIAAAVQHRIASSKN
ncbi:APC family permease [Candidatus Dependentiae bacterium]|nr:APC family permease [Candidatus Dependentiae bacterium]